MRELKEQLEMVVSTIDAVRTMPSREIITWSQEREKEQTSINNETGKRTWTESRSTLWLSSFETIFISFLESQFGNKNQKNQI